MKSPSGERSHSGMVHRAQGFQTTSGDRREAILAAALRQIEERAEKLRRESGHIAGNDQIPVRTAGAEGGVDAAQGPPGVDRVGKDGDAEVSVSLHRTDQGNVAGGLTDQSGNAFHQRVLSGGKQSFVAAHAGAVASGQNKTSSHEMMVPRENCPAPGNGLALVNKSVYICFILALVMLAASPMRAAEAELQKTVVRNWSDPRTGKLVRSTVVVRPAVSAPSASLTELVERSAKAHNVDPLLVDSVIQVESGYNPNAVSPKGAQGLMQLMPPTAQMLGVNDSFNPAENIEAGVKYLKYLQDLV